MSEQEPAATSGQLPTKLPWQRQPPPPAPRAENAKINVTNEPYFGTYTLCNYLPFSKAAKGAQGGPQQYATFERTVFCNFHFSDDQSRWQLLEEGQIIAHFLGRSYDLHIYFGIFCTGCSVDLLTMLHLNI